jgi:hypothetical protein
MFNHDCSASRMIHESLSLTVELWHQKILITEAAELELLIEYSLAVYRIAPSVFNYTNRTTHMNSH